MTRQRQTQENEERFYLDKFLAAVRVQPDSIARGGDPPDFMLTVSQKRFAVEITEFHSDAKGAGGQPRRAVEEEFRKLQDLFREERSKFPDLDRVYGTLYFRELDLPPQRRQFKFIKELLEFSRSVLPQLTKERVKFDFFEPSYVLLNKYLKGLHLKKARCYITWGWNYAAGGVGLSQSELLNTISPKLRISRPPEVAENWLLVVSGYQVSQCMGLPCVDEMNEYQKLNDALDQSSYDKVYCFQYMFGRVLVRRRDGRWIEILKAHFINNERELLDSLKSLTEAKRPTLNAVR